MAEGIDLKMKVSGANKVQRELKKTGKAAKGMGAGVGGASAAMGGMAAAINPVTAALAVAAAGFVAAAVAAKLTKDAFVGTIKATLKLADDLDEITKKAQSIGATNTDIQLVSNAMALFGVETSQTIKATQKFNQALGQAMLPDAPKTLTAAFDRLGVSARDLANMPLRERFIRISEGFATYENQATRAADASLLFGRMGKDALTAFSQGGEAMSAALVDVERYGLASDQAFKNAENLVDAQFRLELAFKGLKTEALEPLMPVLEGVAQGMADLLADMDPTSVDEFGESLADMAEMSVVALVATGPMLEQVAKGFKLLAGAAALIGISELKKLEFLTGGLVDLEGSQGRWSDWGDTILDTIRATREAAAGPMLGPEPPPTDDGGSVGTPAGGKRGGKRTDPNAALKRELEAIRQGLRTKQQAMDEALEIQRESIRQGIEANLLTEQQGMAQEIALATAHDAELLRMAEQKASAEKAIADKAAAERAAMREAERLARQAEHEAELAFMAEFAAQQQAAAVAVLGSVESLAGSVGSIITSLAGENNKEAKEAAKVMFGIQQAASLATAIVATAQAVSLANASAPPPFNVPAIVAASATGAAQIGTIVATTVAGIADAGLPPGALKQAGLNNHTVLAVRNDEMVLDPVGTAAISRMLEQRSAGAGQPIVVQSTVEIDGEVLGRTMDDHLVRSSERGLGYQQRIRY